MVRRVTVFCTLLSLCVAVHAQPTTAPASQPSEISVSDKDALTAVTDKDATVTGTVASAKWSSSGKVLLIKFADTSTTGFTSVIFSKNKEAFDKAFGGDVAAALKGAKASVHGTVKIWAARDDQDKKPEVIIGKADDLKILSAPTTAPNAAPSPSPRDDR